MKKKITKNTEKCLNVAEDSASPKIRKKEDKVRENESQIITNNWTLCVEYRVVGGAETLNGLNRINSVLKFIHSE